MSLLDANAAFQLFRPLIDLGNSIDFSPAYFLKDVINEVDAKIPLVQQLDDMLGSRVLAKYMLGMFFVYPFAFILKNLPSKHIKHLFSLIGGVFLMQWVFGEAWVHSLITSAVTYLLCMIAPRKQLPTIVFLWAMGYMVAAHVFQMVVTEKIAYEKKPFDWTGTQMVLTMKLTSFAWNLYDGTADLKAVEEGNKTGGTMFKSRYQFMVTSLPNPMEFFGYIFCFNCILAGPAFEYRDYIKAIDGTAFVNNSKRSVSSNIPPALFCLGQGVFCLVLHMALTGQLGSLVPLPVEKGFTLDDCYKGYHQIAKLIPSEMIGTNFVLLYRFAYLYVALFASRMKFYFAWKVAEGSCIMGGFGFEGFDKNDSPIGWKGVQNIDMLGFEMATSIQELSAVWNKRTAGWLARYTYMRTPRKYQMFITYLVSSVWHGLYPGFFLFFLTVPFAQQTIQEGIRTYFNPLFIDMSKYDPKKPTWKEYPKTPISVLWWLSCWFGTTCLINGIVQTFSMGTWENCVAALGALDFWPHKIVSALFVFFFALSMIAPSKKASSDKGDDSNKKTK